MTETDSRKPGPGERLLDEALWRMRSYVHAGQAETVAATLYAAATYAVDCFEAFPRVLFTSEGYGAGKTTFMMTTAYLSQNPEDVSGTRYALTSMLAAYHNAPEKGRPTLYLDEVQSIFGKSGLSGSSNPLAGILRKGYKKDAYDMWSVNRVAEKISTFSPFMMAGLGTAVPSDIRSRCLVLKTTKGKPDRDLDSDGADRMLRQTGKSLGLEVCKHRAEMVGVSYEERGIEGLENRVHQCWRPMLAIAEAVGGPKWYAMALQAYHDLTRTDKGKSELSATQEVLRDLADIVRGLNLANKDYVPGAELTERLAQLPRFEGWKLFNVAQEIGHAMPVPSTPKRPNGSGSPVRVYYVKDILAAWEDARPDAEVEGDYTEDIERDLDEAFV